MDENYKIRLVAKNEGLEYQDEYGKFYFNVLLKNNEWNVYLPASYGALFQPYVLSQNEKERILPRIKQFLSFMKWFGLFGCSYSVKIIEQGNEI